MQFNRAAGLYSAPFPSDDLRRADGTIDVSAFPNVAKVDLIQQALSLLAKDARGFGLASGVFFTLADDLKAVAPPALPDPDAPDAAIFLVDLQTGKRHPITLHYSEDPGPFGAPHLLSLLPIQGIPLRERTTYAAVILRRWATGSPDGEVLGRSLALQQLLADEQPAGLSGAAHTAYQDALQRLSLQGIAQEDIAALSVFTTDSPTQGLSQFRADALTRPLPQPDAALTKRETFADYCVYQATIQMPDYQQGEPPYAHGGGGWALDAQGKPVAPHPMRSNLWVTVPRRAMPGAGYPTAVFVRTGGGGDRPLVDRGAQLSPGGPAIEPGTGPALHFAQAGYAGVSVDGPLGGLRNPDMADEQFLIFNIQNATALRDNVRESALEIALLPYILDGLSIDTRDCPGAAPRTTFDLSQLSLMGHSTGSVIATLALAAEPRYRTSILSGAGGSWIENILHKRKPQDVRPLAEIILGYAQDSRELHEHDPALSLVQWAAEPADGQVYAPLVIGKPPGDAPPRHVLMLQGIVDNYIRPPIALAESVPLGLDLAGAALDAQHPELRDETHLMDVLPRVGRRQINLPVTGNLTLAGRQTTAVVVQHPQDPYEDGHEVVFQTEAPKHQYRCFLLSALRGTPLVPVAAAANAPCP